MPESSPRVLQVLGSSAGGVARHVAHVADILGSAGITVEVAGPAYALVIVRVGVPQVIVRPVEISDRPRPGEVAAVRVLRTLFREPEVVHAHGLRAGALSVIAARSLPRGRRPRVVVTLHNLPVGGASVRLVSALLERIVGRGADVVLGVSGDLVERARSRGARHAERALVPAPKPLRAEPDRARLRADLGVVDGAGALVVTVARLAPQKGLDLLLDTAELLSRRAGLHWLVAGEGPLEAALTARIARDGLPARLLGRRSDVADLLVAADVVVQTSVWEGQPLVLQEALALGCSIVATDVGGTREVTGDAAALVPFGDPNKLAAAIGAVLDDRRHAADLASRARRRAAELPGRDAVLEQLRHVYAIDGPGTSARRVG